MQAYTVYIPIRTVSESNTACHWRERYKRCKTQKETVLWYLQGRVKIEDAPERCVRVNLTRVGKRHLDSDNLPGSLKAIRDAVADVLIPGMPPGRADDDDLMTWSYSQEVGDEYGVRVSIEWQESPRAPADDIQVRGWF